jgi:hypothetical protein
MVTRQPATAKCCRISGKAVISSGTLWMLASTFTWARTSRVVVAHALTRWIARFDSSRDLRNVLPSRAITSAGRMVRTACIQVWKQCWKLDRIERRKDPVEGVVGGDARGRSKKVANHSSLASPNCSMSSQPSAPLMTAQMAMAMMLSKGCSLVRSTRGSSSAAQCSARVTGGEDVMVGHSSKVGLTHPTQPATHLII